jgi:hypothetical protein
MPAFAENLFLEDNAMAETTTAAALYLEAIAATLAGG